jgi:hypothetical protein
VTASDFTTLRIGFTYRLRSFPVAAGVAAPAVSNTSA